MLTMLDGVDIVYGENDKLYPIQLCILAMGGFRNMIFASSITEFVRFMSNTAQIVNLQVNG
jgi:hypothetical protein